MKTASDFLSEKLHELFARDEREGGISSFTRAERALWLIVRIQSANEMDGLESVFDEALSRSEVIEAIGYLREFEQSDVAALLEQAVALLNTNQFYSQTGERVMYIWDLPKQPLDELGTIGYRITECHWDIDEKLAAMFNVGVE